MGLTGGFSVKANWLRRIATYDFSPEFSAKVRRFFFRPLGILLLAAGASLLCGLFLHAQGFVLFGGVVAIVALGVIWPWLSLCGLTGKLEFEQVRATEGENVGVKFTLRNSLPWTAWGLALKGGFDALPGEAVVGIASAPRRRTSLCRWRFQPNHRGVYPLGPSKLTTGFPFGLWENGRVVGVEAPLIVWPKTFPVGPIPPVGGDRQVEGNVSRRKVGTNGDVLGVRPYRRGDSPRRIHWAQSARHDRLIVCELQSNSRPVIQLVLDADERVQVGTGADSSWEWSIRIAASFAKGWLADGAQVGLAWGDDGIPPASGQAQLHRILDALAGLQPSATKRLGDVLACPKCRGFRDGLQVIVTTDRSHVHDGCGACETEDQRWVILKSSGFSERLALAPCGDDPEPWLTVESPRIVPALLKGGWREARHGS